MPDDGDIAISLIDERLDQFGLISKGLLSSTGPRACLSVAEEVDRDDMMPILERLDRAAPLAVTGHRAVQEDHARTGTRFD